MKFQPRMLQADTWHVDVVADGEAVSRREFMTGLATSPVVRSQLTEVLRDCPFEAVAWETPPFCSATAGLAAEFVAVNSPQLAGVAADSGPFAEHFGMGRDVAVFQNLGGSSTLVAPEPKADVDATHLLVFLRTAANADADSLWAAVGKVMQEVPSEPRWLSTAGLGVYWLHVRIDPRPKYYRHRPYRRVADSR